jgi:hypothetical protein
MSLTTIILFLTPVCSLNSGYLNAKEKNHEFDSNHFVFLLEAVFRPTLFTFLSTEGDEVEDEEDEDLVEEEDAGEDDSSSYS